METGAGGKKQLPHQKNLISHSDTHEKGGGGGAADAGFGGGRGELMHVYANRISSPAFPTHPSER